MKKNIFTLEDLQKRGLKVSNANGLKLDTAFYNPAGSKGYSANNRLQRDENPEKRDENIKNVKKLPKADPEGLAYIKGILRMLKVDFETEYVFHATRKFRFDIALIDKKIAIEYEGLFSEKSRHTQSAGYTGDCRKYNLAQTDGWKILRYTALNYKEFYSELKKLIPSI